MRYLLPGSTRIDFGPQLRGLDKDKFTLVALDPRGYGKSIPPQRKWSMEFFERDVEDAMGLMRVCVYTNSSMCSEREQNTAEFLLLPCLKALLK